MSYYANVNVDLLAWMTLDAERVLEIGCGTGSLAAAYRERNPGAYYTAVEIPGAAAEEARSRVDRLLLGDVHAMSDEEVCGGDVDDHRFDLIVLGDVLARVGHAEALLDRMRAIMSYDGRLLLSVPNVGHWTVFHHLLHGIWPRQAEGLFDRRNDRFFTLQSLQEMLTQTGFASLKFRPRYIPLNAEMANHYIPPLADLAAARGIDRDDFVRRASVLQYVAISSKTRVLVPPLMHLVLVGPEPAADARARLALDYLQTVPEVMVRHQQQALPLPEADRNAPKVIVVPGRDAAEPEAWSTFLAEAIVKGWMVVIDCGDQEVQHAGKAHAVQTSIPALVDEVREQNPEIGLFPAAAFGRPPFPEGREGAPRVFHGARSLGDSAEPLAKALAPAIEAIPELTFHIVDDRAFFDALPTDRKHFLPALPYADHNAELAKCDIALLPFEGRPEDLFETDLGYVEAGAAGVAVIASSAYAATIRDGETGLLAPGLQDWAPALIRLASDADERTRIARAAWDDVGANRMFARQVSKRMAWYRALWERREELNEALVERVPGLAERLES